MTNIPCQQCQGPTRLKQFKSKAGRDMVIYECISGCMDTSGRYALGTFPPRAPVQGTPYNAGPYRPPQQTPAQPMQYQPPQQQPALRPIQGNPTLQNEQVILLRRIETQLKNVVQMLQKLSGVAPIQPEELTPDEHFDPSQGDEPPAF